jgi:hypothetical protein
MAKAVDYNFSQHLQNSYNRKPTANAEFKRFSEEYFSGQDVRIYFGNTWVDEIVGIQYNLQENAAPILGYASYTYDRMAVGSRQVVGTFRINFKESYYLHFITNRLESELSEAKVYAQSNPTKTKDLVSPEHMLAVSTSNSAKFEQLAYEFEESLWGVTTNTGMQSNTNSRGSDSYFTPTKSRPNLAKKGFTIELLYGPYTQNYATGALTENVASTATTITGVYLTGVSQVVDGSGQPIYEEYSFIGRDINENVNMYESDPRYSFGVES